MSFYIDMITRRRAAGAAGAAIDWDTGQVTLKLGSLADDVKLGRLAMLHNARPLRQPILLAELDGAVVAALSLSTGAAVVHPLHRVSGLVELLRVRACQLAMREPAGAGRLDEAA